MTLPQNTEATEIMVMSRDWVSGLMQAAMQAEQIGLAFGPSGFVGIYADMIIYNQHRERAERHVIKVDENFGQTVEKLRWAE